MSCSLSKSLFVSFIIGGLAVTMVMSVARGLGSGQPNTNRDPPDVKAQDGQPGPNRNRPAPYRVDPPDILLIECLKVLPKPPYRIEPLDVLTIGVNGVAPSEEPINGAYAVDLDGTVDLGRRYGKVHLTGLSLDQAKEAVKKHLKQVGVREPGCFMALAKSRAMEQVRGERLVRPDGTVGLGTYGSVYVAGMSLPEVKTAIEAHLSQFLQKPEVSVDVGAFNSKVYYVATEGGDAGDNLTRHAFTGKETVLDAIASHGGLHQLSSKKIWIVRPSSDGKGESTILSVDWTAITREKSMASNYQIGAGDLLVISANKQER